MKQIMTLALITVSLSSCFQQFYKTNTTPKIDAVAFEKLQTQRKVFFVHTPGGVFMLKDSKIENDVLTGNKYSSSPKYERYMNPIANESNRYPKREKAIALSQVHVYTNNTFQDVLRINLAVNQIFRMDVYSKDIMATRKSRVISIAGIVLPVAIVVACAATYEAQPINLNLSGWH